MAAGSGLTAASDTGITKFIVGVTTTPYTTPANNYVACYTTQFTAATKAGATEWTTASDTAYARQAMGAAGAGWTIAAYASGTGVVWSNTNTITQPAVAGTSQTLFAIGWCDTVGPTGGNIDFFADLGSSQTVNIGVSVVLASNSPGPAGITFTTY